MTNKEKFLSGMRFTLEGIQDTHYKYVKKMNEPGHIEICEYPDDIMDGNWECGATILNEEEIQIVVFVCNQNLYGSILFEEMNFNLK